MFDLIPQIIEYIFGSSLDKSGQDAFNVFKSFVNKANFTQKIATSLAYNKFFDTVEHARGKESGGSSSDGGSSSGGSSSGGGDGTGVV
jgi:uncharacterized membrane protein YgcG